MGPEAGPVPAKAPTVSDYELLRRIGGGAYGEVWLARSKATGALRAAKIVWRARFEDDRPYRREFEGIQRFEKISREHPSQLALFHIGRNDAEGYFYYVMELADAVSAKSPVVGNPKIRAPKEVRNPKSETSATGEKGRSSDSGTALASGIQDSDTYVPHILRADLSSGPLPAERVLEIGLALSEALEHLHQHGLIHRDVKPSNVIFVNGRPKLADIGLVTDASDQCSIVGTEGYLPPEGPGTPQADIFALGKVLYEAATGMDRRRFAELPEDLHQWPEHRAVVELNEIVLRACAKDPAARYSSCQQMHAELTLLGKGQSVRQKRTRQQRWAMVKKCVVGAALAGGLIASVVVLWRQPRVPPPLSKNPQAVERYQQAVYQLHSATMERHMQAYTNLLEAVKLDPTFVDAYYMIFEAYFVGDQMPPYYNLLTNSQVVVARLRELSPDSVQYHTANSYVKFLEWKLDEAIQEVKLAININHAFVRAHGMYGGYMMYVYEDAETALRELRIAKDLDPTDVTIQCVLGQPYFLQRNYDEAIKQWNKALQLEERASLVYYFLGQAYEAAGQYEKAFDNFEHQEIALLSRGQKPEEIKEWYQQQRTALREKGFRGVWEIRLEKAKSNPSPQSYWIAACHAELGHTNEAMIYLNRAYNEHTYDMLKLLYDTYWDSLRDYPPFQELLNKMGFHPKH
jgi:serine/threonine protein kinase